MRFLFIALICTAVTACGEPPQIDEISATTASYGDEVVVTGSNFDELNDVGFRGLGYLNGVPSTNGTRLSFSVSSLVGVCAQTQQDDDVACISLGKVVAPGEYEIFVATEFGDSNSKTLVIQ